MRISHFSVDRPVTIIMLLIAVVVLGAVSLSGISLDLMPEMNLPIAIVTTSYSGASPQEMENIITKPLESSLATTSDIENITSYSSVGNSLLLVEFDWDTDMSDATLEMREKIDMIEGYLPEDATNPMVMQLDPNMMPIMQFAVTGNRDTEEIKSIVEDTMISRLERIEGVASVSLTGGKTREISVVLDPAKLNSYGLTMGQVMQAIQSDNISMSAGLVEKGSKDLIINVEGEFQDPSEISQVIINTPMGAAVRVGDVAQVTDGYKEQNAISKMNGKEAISLSVNKQSGANTVAVADDVKAEMARLQKELPEDFVVDVFFDSSEYIVVVINAVATNMMLGALLAALVLFLFLRDVRSTMIVALSIPISVIATFVLMYFFNLTLNIMTLGGLALGIGMMVDNSIVVLENIFRHNQLGEERMGAAKIGASEVTAAIFASTLTTVAVFFPIAFTGGMTSTIFNELALTVSFSLLASLFVAITATPMLSSRMIRVDAHHRAKDSLVKRMLTRFNKNFEALNHAHGRFLSYALIHKRRIVIIFSGIFVASLFLIPFVGQEFFPASDEGQVTVSVTMPTGTKLAETSAVIADLEDYLGTMDDVDSIATMIGSGGMQISLSGDSTNAGSIYLYLNSDRERSTDEVVETIRQHTVLIPGADITVSAADSMGGGMSMGSAISISIKGDDIDTLQELSTQVGTLVDNVEGTREVSSSLDKRRPEMRIVVDREKASAYGLNAYTIASTARMAIGGSTVTRYTTGSEEIDVRIMLAEDARDSVQEIGSINIMSPLGYSVPLNQVADIENVNTPNTITRNNQVREVTVSGDIFGRDLNSVVTDIQGSIDENVVLPEGYDIVFGGTAEQMAETFADLSLVVLLAIALVYMILASQFESFLYPFIIMFTLPFTIIGVIWSLLITNQTLNVVSFIGIVMLVGIVVNNAIVLIDYINRLKNGGMESGEAIINAASARLRPIIMTTLTTILAMIPLAMGLGDGGEMFAPLGVAIIGGLAVSTLITLVFIPVIYSIFDQMKEKRAARKKRKNMKVQEEVAQ